MLANCSLRLSGRGTLHLSILPRNDGSWRGQVQGVTKSSNRDASFWLQRGVRWHTWSVPELGEGLWRRGGLALERGDSFTAHGAFEPAFFLTNGPLSMRAYRNSSTKSARRLSWK